MSERTLIPQPTPASEESLEPEALSDSAQDYLRHSVSANTVRALKADLGVFAEWGGQLPATEDAVANFLADHGASKKTATLYRYANSLHIWHTAHELPSPVRTEKVRRVLKGIRRQQSAHQDSAPPLLLADFQQMLDAMVGAAIRTVRDRALLAVAFFGAFRRSEVVGLQLADLRIREEGLIIGLRHSKTNQGGATEDKAIARGPQGSPYCPVQLLEQWLAVYEEQRDERPKAPVFPALDPAGIPQSRGMTPENFYHLFKGALRRAGFDPGEYSPHSLRSGFITSAYLAGKDPFKIKRISGHRSQTTFERYLHEADRFQSNASDLL